ncbi:MAG TPA: cytochrome c oxidase assembly protein [Jatrophihabitans sp.]|nr:cytochrome c oxidase assembly protein [Jatrophihabitans sp.]
MTDDTAHRRVPGMVWAAWALTAALIAGLAVAVWHHLATGSGSTDSGMAGMSSMQSGHLSESFYRVGGGSPSGPLLSSRLITAWQLDAVAVAVLLVLAACYVTGVLAARRRGQVWPAQYTLAFAAGLVVVGLATNSSIAVYDMSLFTAHMLGHLMLVMLAPALLMAGRPFNLMLAATSGERQARIRRVLLGRAVSLLTAPPVALASYTVVIVGTHLTGLMDQIMRYTWLGQLEHLTYLVLGCQFFVVVIGDPPIRWRLGVPARLFMLALSMAVDTFTGIVLLQTKTAIHMMPPPNANINPLTDTQTGGAIMWFGGDGIMAVIMVSIAIGWIYRQNARVEPGGWLEQARRANFAAHTGHLEPADGFDPTAADFDDDERRLSEYNDWLRKLNAH